MCELPPDLTTANRSPEPDTLPHPMNEPTFTFTGNRKKRRRDKALARKPLSKR